MVHHYYGNAKKGKKNIGQLGDQKYFKCELLRPWKVSSNEDIGVSFSLDVIKLHKLLSIQYWLSWDTLKTIQNKCKEFLQLKMNFCLGNIIKTQARLAVVRDQYGFRKVHILFSEIQETFWDSVKKQLKIR